MNPSKTTTVKGPYPTFRPYFSTLLGIDHERQNCRVSAAKWYWSRKMGLRHYIIETEQLPVVVEVRRKPGENFAGGEDV